MDEVCAPGYRGRKRGQVVRTRTVISQAHSSQWLGTFGNRGNGRYREELRKALVAVGRYLTAYQLPQERTLLRLDGQYGTGAVLADLAGFAFVTRGKEDSVLDHPLVQARLHLPPDQMKPRPESQMVRSLYDCESVPVGPEGVLCRVVVATHPAGKKKSPVGVTRDGVVYELFLTNLPQQGVTAHERRREVDGSMRVVYRASIRSCRSCRLREQCQWNGGATAMPRQVSVLLHPLQVGAAPLLLRYSRRRTHRRACLQLVRHQRLEMSLSPPTAASPPIAEVTLSRAQRARYRLGFQERQARNAHVATACQVTIRVFGVPAAFAFSLRLATV